jgi:hypothetical protein
MKMMASRNSLIVHILDTYLCGVHMAVSRSVRRNPAGSISGPDNSFTPDNAHFERAPIVHDVDHGDHGFFGKIHFLDVLIRPINDLTPRQCHVFELGQKAFVFCGEEGGENAVPDRKRRVHPHVLFA